MEPTIPEILKTTAKNMFELLMQVAAHIEKLEAENATLKEENGRLKSQS